MCLPRCTQYIEFSMVFKFITACVWSYVLPFNEKSSVQIVQFRILFWIQRLKCNKQIFHEMFCLQSILIHDSHTYIIMPLRCIVWYCISHFTLAANHTKESMLHLVFDLKINSRNETCTDEPKIKNWVHYEPSSSILMYTSYDQWALNVSWLHEIYTCVNILSGWSG